MSSGSGSGCTDLAAEHPGRAARRRAGPAESLVPAGHDERDRVVAEMDTDAKWDGPAFATIADLPVLLRESHADLQSGNEKCRTVTR